MLNITLKGLDSVAPVIVHTFIFLCHISSFIAVCFIIGEEQAVCEKSSLHLHQRGFTHIVWRSKPELQIKGDIKDNSEIIFPSFQRKHTL